MKKLLSLMCSLLIIVTLCGCSSTQDQQEEVTLTLAAAASLENTFEDKLIPEFEKENPNIKVQGVYDSSGKLQIQIEQGLKADVFFSAATKQMDALVDEKYINKKDVVDLLENKLVLITGKQTTTEVKGFADIAKAETIAIGNPEVVPAGQYAKMALTHLGLYDALTSKYSLGGNVTEVLNWVASSSSDVGIVYSTDAKSSKDVKVLATCENSLLDEPVIYPVAKLAQTKHSDETEKFIKFIQKKSSLKQFENYGFTEDAIGSVLWHAITEIVKDQRKGPRFKKGHIIKEEDIEVLLNLGKEHLYVFEKDETMMHENDAAEILCNLCFNEYMKKSAISEGKIELTSTIDGLFKVNREELFKVNSFGQMMIATRQGNVPVKKGDKLAGMRIIPLVIEKEKMQQIQEIVQKPLLKIMPYQIKTAGIITTGSEVYKGRIKDTFTPVIVEKLKEYGVEVTYHSLSLDDHEMTTSKINEALKQGVDLVLCTGGMSVDPDDKTPLAIKNTGAKIISYGAPVLPGAMFLLSYKDDVPIVGLPGCVMYSRRTIFDVVLPRLLAKDLITSDELALLGEGGLCLNCPVCTFPNCGLSKG